MRPRIAFAVLLAIGAAIHLPLIAMPARSLVPVAVYFGWLLLSGVVAAAFYLGVTGGNPVQDRRARLLGRVLPRPRVEGLGWFVITAVSALALHLLHAFGGPGPRPGTQNLWLVFFALAVGSFFQLRGPLRDSDAPLPDESNVVRVGYLLRRLIGVAIICIGVGLFYIGSSSSGSPGDGFALTISWFFKASGVSIVLLIGLPLALMPPRDDA